MSRNPRPTTLVMWFGVVLALMLCTVQASAQDGSVDEEAAFAAFNTGNQAYIDGDFVRAAEHFARANELNPTPVLLEYIAHCYASAGEWDLAIEAYRNWAAAEPQVEAEVEAMIADMSLMALETAWSQALRRVDIAVAVASDSRPQVFERYRQEFGSNIRPVVDIQIITDPPGATIYLGNLDFPLPQTTPFQGETFVGPTFLRLELAHHAPIQDSLLIQPPARGASIPQFQYTFERLEGEVEIAVDPLTANVSYIGADGEIRQLGSGAWAGTLPSGPGTFVLQHAGDSRRIEVVVEADAPNAFELALVDRPQSTPSLISVGTIVVVCQQRDVQVSVDGRVIGSCPGEHVADVTSGAHVVEVTADGYETWRQEIEVGPDAEVRVYAAEVERARRGGRR